MSNYLMKYKGIYRVLPEYDSSTNDVPRDKKGNISDGYDDLYIACSYGNKIYHYGRNVLVTYIPSIGRGHNVIKALDELKIKYENLKETDSEVEFHFKAKDIEPVANLLKARTSGANISPFSIKNLPKSNVEIPSGEIKRYKEITSVVPQSDLLLIHKITSMFLVNVLEKKSKKNNKLFDYKRDMKKLMLGRQTKEYIWTKGFWSEYLSYLQKEIGKIYEI